MGISGIGSSSSSARHVVLIHGLLGWGPGQLVVPGGPVSYWETATDSRTDTCGLTVLEAGVGPVSSLHDRACELFAQLLGRRTDYGAEHSSVHGHHRWGTDYTGRGLCPDWCADRPVHLVGHSAGGNTARQLQRLLADDHWAEGTGPDWVRSITCLASPLNGSPAVHLFGCDPATGQFRWPRLLSNLARLAPRAWLLDHWGLTDGDVASPARLRSCGLLDGADNLSYDLTLQGCAAANQPGHLDDWPGTYYMSSVARCTVPGSAGSGFVSPSPDCRRLLRLSCTYLCSRGSRREPHHDGKPAALSSSASSSSALARRPLPSYYSPAEMPDWRHNDGLVPVASQRYPLVGARIVAGPLEDQTPLEPGRWYYEDVAGLVGPPQHTWDHSDFTVLRGPLLDLALSAEGRARRLLLCGRRCRRRFLRSPVDDVDADAAENDRDVGAESGGLVSRRMQRLFYERLFRRLSCLS